MHASWELDARSKHAEHSSSAGARCVSVLVGPLVRPGIRAQGGSAKSTIAGIVVDPAGGVLPGATVVVKNTATSVETAAVTNTAGALRRPGARCRQIHRDGVAERVQDRRS